MAARNMYRIEINIHEKLFKLVIYKDHIIFYLLPDVLRVRSIASVLSLIPTVVAYHGTKWVKRPVLGNVEIFYLINFISKLLRN